MRSPARTLRALASMAGRSRDIGLTGLLPSSPVRGDCGGLAVTEMAAIVAALCVLLLLHVHLSETHLPLVIKVFD